jgi:hypothetical protein
MSRPVSYCGEIARKYGITIATVRSYGLDREMTKLAIRVLLNWLRRDKNRNRTQDQDQER